MVPNVLLVAMGFAIEFVGVLALLVALSAVVSMLLSRLLRDLRAYRMVIEYAFCRKKFQAWLQSTKGPDLVAELMGNN